MGIVNGIKSVIGKAMAGITGDMVISPRVLAADGGLTAGGAGRGNADLLSGISSAISTALAGGASSGDIVIPVYLGTDMIDEIVVTAICDIANRIFVRSNGLFDISCRCNFGSRTLFLRICQIFKLFFGTRPVLTSENRHDTERRQIRRIRLLYAAGGQPAEQQAYAQSHTQQLFVFHRNHLTVPESVPECRVQTALPSAQAPARQSEYYPSFPLQCSRCCLRYVLIRTKSQKNQRSYLLRTCPP